MAAPAEGVGWPFLVAAGRVRDHTVIVAPDVLVASGEYGVLEMVDGSGGQSASPVREVLLAGGRMLMACHRTRALTARDLTAVVTGPGSAVVKDEHNRPLRALVGIVVQDPSSRVSEADLEVAWERVLPAYQRFLDDEFGFAVASSVAMPLSRSADLVLREPQRPYALPTRERAGRPPARLGRVIVPLVVAVAACVALVLHPWSQPTPVIPVPTVTSTSTASTTTTAMATAVPTGDRHSLGWVDGPRELSGLVGPLRRGVADLRPAGHRGTVQQGRDLSLPPLGRAGGRARGGRRLLARRELVGRCVHP